MKSLTVSVIIPTYNSSLYIKEALQSVEQQNGAMIEIICVDDTSTDGTVDLIKDISSEIIVLRNKKNEGPSYCRNIGLKHAHGDFIAFLDSDDYWLPGKTSQQLQTLQADASIGIVAGLTDYFKMKDTPARPEDVLINKPHFNNYLSSVMIRKAVFNKIGLFNEALRFSEDHDWFLRAREANIRIKVSENCVTFKRIHNNNITKDKDFRSLGLLNVLKISLDRRRQKLSNQILNQSADHD